MKIFDGEQQLDFPPWITISSGSVKIENNTQKINGMYGERIRGDENFSVRTFKCSGVLDAINYSEVEKLRSKITDMLACKLLRVYRDDDDDVFYNCILDGEVSVTYNNGVRLARAFTITFNLKAIEPFAYENKKVLYISNKTATQITINGNQKVYPDILFYGQTEYTDDLFCCDERKITLKENVIINNNESLFFIQSGLYKMNNATKAVENITTCLDKNSIIKPIFFSAGENTMTIQGTGIIFYNDTYK